MRDTKKTKAKRYHRRLREWIPLGGVAPNQGGWCWIFHDGEVKSAYLATIFKHHKRSREYYPAAEITHFMEWDRKKPSEPLVFLEPIERVDYMVDGGTCTTTVNQSNEEELTRSGTIVAEFHPRKIGKSALMKLALISAMVSK